MKTTFVKAVTGVLFLFLFAGTASAYPTNIADTNKTLLASAEKTPREIILREANVIYPDIFCGHEEKAMDYVEKFSVSRRDYLIRIYNKGKKYFPKVEEVLKKHEVPTEYKVLLALESGFNGNARSRAGAVGYWQFMDAVAKEYGLRISERAKVRSKHKGRAKTKKRSSVDDRKNFMKSTFAAARYLRDRTRNLDNDWLLIAASYNCGVGNVWNAIKRTGKPNASYWEIRNYLPKETRSYVMNFIALNVIFHNYENFSKNNLCFRNITAIEESTIQTESSDITGPVLNN